MGAILIIVVMGVSGSGKTTVGRKLAQQLGWVFADADDFHPPANIAKMSAGIPLDDIDRTPWLAQLHAHLRQSLHTAEPMVLACSALKAAYREQLTVDASRQRFVFLSGSFELILERMRQRQDHFMKEDLLRSQYDALENPADALTLDAASPPAALVAQIRHAFSL